MIRKILRKLQKNGPTLKDYYLKKFESLTVLQSILKYADSSSESIGLSISDYVVLYEYVKKHKPKHVLECGTGKSTLVIAQAMLENSIEDPVAFPMESMKLISMENEPYWYEQSSKILPEKYRDFTEIHYSPLSTYTLSMLNGVIYESIPQYPYDFMFIDGPPQSIDSPLYACDIDFIKYVNTSDKPVAALIDNRKHTVLACALAFGRDKVTFYPDLGIGHVSGVTKDDLNLGSAAVIRTTFFRDGTIKLNTKPFEA